MFEVGKTYDTKDNGSFECIAFTETHAWLKGGDRETAYVWTQGGLSLSLGTPYDIKPTPREFWIYNGYVTEVYHANSIHVREVLK